MGLILLICIHICFKYTHLKKIKIKIRYQFLNIFILWRRSTRETDRQTDTKGEDNTVKQISIVSDRLYIYYSHVQLINNDKDASTEKYRLRGSTTSAATGLQTVT